MRLLASVCFVKWVESMGGGMVYTPVSRTECPYGRESSSLSPWTQFISKGVCMTIEEMSKLTLASLLADRDTEIRRRAEELVDRLLDREQKASPPLIDFEPNVLLIM